ncbi:ParB/RepB/Spo0J family partition protein [bacterium BMS3Abin03]|jgi:ParB family chromosome partitioning protein|nr:ParB/RepB/Spo0J family partition protein [bacterium BMS3Abin03]MCG6959706.1 ParB/RepB/Spo0J family partition protein [bacterium BMS3Abin03]
MSKVKHGLGRGLDALIKPQDYVKSSSDNKNIKDDDGKQVDVLAKISVDFISRNPFQPRTAFNTEAMEELKRSILSNGLIQPITVRRTPDHKYQLISGERRLNACREIGYREIPAYIIKVESDELMLALALIENLQREKLNPIEIGLAYKRLMDECHLTQEAIADRVGKDRTTIANSIRLLKLPKKVQDSLISGAISSGHARALINLPTEDAQLSILEKIIGKNLSVRKVEKLVKEYSTDNISTVSKKSFKISPRTGGVHIKDIEDKLRKIFGTKVLCKQKKDGSGEISIEYYSNEELERLFELFEIIDKNYN